MILVSIDTWLDLDSLLTLFNILLFVNAMGLRNIFHKVSGIKNKNKFEVSKQTNISNNEISEISSFRRVLPQILASSAKNLLIVDFGLSIAFSTILIPALTGLNTTLNPNETMIITPDEATWLASVTVIFQPIGGVLTGFTEPMGRKKALICVNIPYAIAWLLLYYSASLTMIYVAFALLGLGIGLMEAPIFTYIGEICEPGIRGMLTASASIAAALGMLLVYFLGNQTSWRNAALFCSSIPILAIFVILFVPETPIFLLSKDREAEALKSLQWLRGWVSPQNVQEEFSDLQRCKKTAQVCYECEKEQKSCSHPPPTLRQKIRDLMRRRTLRPFSLVACLFFLSAFTAINLYRPYLVQVLYFYESPVDPNEVIVWMGYVGLLANVALVFTIRYFGKRKIYLWSMAAIIVISFALGAYGFLYLPLDTTSFDIVSHNNTQLLSQNPKTLQYLPIIGFNLLQILGNYGVSAIPNMMMCEVFPFKSKAFATGLVATSLYFSMFIASKTFYTLEMLFTLPGLGFFYGFVGVIGLIGMYLTLPETEGRTIEDVELYFADRKRKFNDIRIPYVTNQQAK